MDPGAAAGTATGSGGSSGAGRANRATWLPVSSPKTLPCVVQMSRSDQKAVESHRHREHLSLQHHDMTCSALMT